MEKLLNYINQYENIKKLSFKLILRKMFKIFVLLFLSLTLKSLNGEKIKNQTDESCLDMNSWKEFKIEFDINFDDDADFELDAYALFLIYI